MKHTIEHCKFQRLLREFYFLNDESRIFAVLRQKRMRRCQCYNMFTWFTIMIQYPCQVHIVKRNCEPKTSKSFYVCFGGWLTIQLDTKATQKAQNDGKRDYWGRFNDAGFIASQSFSHFLSLHLSHCYAWPSTEGTSQSVWFEISHWVWNSHVD